MSEPIQDQQVGQAETPTRELESSPAVRLKRLLRPFLGALALLFVGYAAWKLRQQWTGGSVSLSWVPIVASCVPLAAAAAWLAWAWKVLLEHISGQSISTSGAMALNLESQLARYMPGKVGVPAIRMAGAGALGLSARTAVASLFVETAGFIAVGACVAASWLMISGRQGLATAPWLGRGTVVVVALLTVTCLCMVTVDRRHLPHSLLLKLGLQGVGPLMPLSVVLSHVGYWACWGVHGYLLGIGVGGSSEAALRGAPYFIAAPVLGFLALITPGGVGVREAVLSMGLAPGLGTTAALTAAGLSRAVSMAMDVAVWLASRRYRLR